MSNQPKPTTYNPELADVMLNEGDFEGLANEVAKPNKPTGEWTPEWLANFGNSDNWLESICDAHNTTLDAEREKCDERMARNDQINERDIQHEKQKRCAKYEDLISNNQRDIQQLRDQLAAEREKRKQAEDDFILAGRNNGQLRSQLGTLVDASNGLLEALATKDSWGKEVDRLYAALANVKEGK